MIVSPSVSLVAAGVASGICFLLFSTLRRRREADPKRSEKKEIAIDDSRCGCCLKPFLVGRGVRCGDCGVRSCRKGCSRWNISENAWRCLFCHQRRCWIERSEKCFDNLAERIEGAELRRYLDTAKTQIYFTGVENAAAGTTFDLAEGGQGESNAMEMVRDFVERIVESLLRNMDDLSIDRLYDHTQYKSSGNSSGTAHSALRELVERAVDEARKLPGLATSADSERIQEERDVHEHSYEDLLATTILNKVIEKFQNEQVDGNSNILEEKSYTKTKNGYSESQFGLDEGMEEGSSSLEPLETLDSSQDECSSNCSASRNSRILRHRKEPLSLTIEERIEEVTTTYTSDEEPPERNSLRISRVRRVPFPELGMDIVDPSQESSEESQDEIDSSTGHVDLVSPLESWEENWLFQKKRIQMKSDPVAMLVPSSSADFKALIGDKDAEDTSDLSECSSAQSDEEIEKELIEAINNVSPRSPKMSESDFDVFINEERLSDRQEMDENSMESLGLLKSVTSEGVSSCATKNSAEFIGEDKLNNDLTTENARSEVELEEKEVEKEQLGDTLGSNNEENSENSVDNWETVRLTNDKQLEEVHIENNTELIEKIESQNANGGPEALKIEVPKKSETTNTQEFILNEQSASFVNKKEIASLCRDNKDKLMDCSNEKEETSSSFRLDLNATTVDMQGDDEAQQESEYTEHYDTATQRHLDSLTKSDFSSEQNDAINNEEKDEKKRAEEEEEEEEEEREEETTAVAAEMLKCRKAVASAKAQSASNSSSSPSSSLNNLADEDIQLAAPPRPGTIAEREHKKWENAPPIENNPYSEESIQKRLLERQYSRRASDISGSAAELPNSNASELEVILEPHQPDIKRFSRDYYINNAKSASGDKSKKGATSGCGRTVDSLSQREQQQNENLETEAEILSPEAKSKENKLQSEQQQKTRNNVLEVNHSDSCVQNKVNGKNPSIANQNGLEELYENERKNNKNEINALLNNQEGNCMLDHTNKSFGDTQRKIRRIDLKAYGFENEIGPAKSKRSGNSSPRRVINKLDLRSFGYDGGLRRTVSHDTLNSTSKTENCEQKLLVRSCGKSNLTRYEDFDDLNFTKSNETLKKLVDDSKTSFSSMTSAKSVPDIAKSEYYASSSNNDSENDSLSEQNFIDGSNKIINCSSRNGKLTEIIKCYENARLCDSSNVSSDTDMEEKDRSAEKSFVESQDDEFSEEKMNLRNMGNDLPMPSVRRLAEAFSKPVERTPIPAPRGIKQNVVVKDRSTTPEIQIIESPKQMHSLTARSLSKQFRDGLRQIPSKTTSPPASHVVMEQNSSPENEDQNDHQDIVSIKTENDVNVIAPGKLKSNIIFWEQMQRRS